MPDELQFAILRKQGVNAWNDWREQLQTGNVTPDLSKADLRRANLRLANLSQANLREAKLREAYLRRADLNHADLSGADLSRTNFRRANLTGANLSGANLHRANLSLANLSGANLSGADLSGASLIETDLQRATLANANVYGISAWDVNLQSAIQTSLVITPPSVEPPITVDNLEVAQLIYLLVNRRKLRDVITTLGEKVVLILGRFTERKELLDSMATRLRDLNYLPIIFDFDRPTDHDLTETVKVLAGLSRFVIADITNPRSVPFELGVTVPDYMVPFVTILQRGQPPFGMFDDLPRKYYWALPLLEYKNAETLMATFEKKVIEPALQKLDDVRRQKALLPARRSAED